MPPFTQIEDIRADAIEGYHIVQQLGKGATGVVYLAKRDPSGEDVALKILYPERLKDKDRLARATRERDLSSRISHPNVVKCLGWGNYLDTSYLVFEYVRGETLDGIIRRESPIDEKRAARWVLDAARGLAAANELNIIHRDIKPANIIISAEGSAHVMDFGLAREAFDTGLTLQGTILGTPVYIAPEQVRSERSLDIRADIYALGVTFYHAVAGAPPFAGLSLSLLLTKKIIEEIPDPRKANPAVSDEAAAIIMKMTGKERDSRYPLPAALIGDLERFIAGQFTVERPAAERELAAQIARGETLELRPEEELEHPILRALLARQGKPAAAVQLPPGAVLFYEDDFSKDAYILICGKLEVLKAGKRIATISAQGALIGEMSYLLDALRSATIRAVEPTRLVRIAESEFKHILADCPDLALHIASSLAARLSATSEKLKEAHEVIGAIRDHCAHVEGDIDTR